MADAPNPTGINGSTATHMPETVRPYGTSADEGGSLPSPGVGASSPAPGGQPPAMPMIEGLMDPGAPEDMISDGASFGPGPGPESWGAFTPDAPTADMRAFAKYLPMLELLAMQPGSSRKVRNLVRLVKAQMPPQVLEELTNANRQAGRRR